MHPKVSMKNPKSGPVSTELDPDHPNYDAILLKRTRLEAHRRRRLENSGALAAQDRRTTEDNSKKTSGRRKGD
jgi:hypothetical protein